MRVYPLLFVFFFLSHAFSFAQQTVPADNLLLGYQKFPTTISCHASDSLGNQYYVGTFKGELTIDDKVIASGNGLEDLFWAKTNSNGQLLNYKTYGSPGADGTLADALAMGDNGNMLFGVRIMEAITFGSVTVTPYTPSTPYGTLCIVNADTSGAVKWVKATNLPAFKIFYADHVFHVFGIVYPNSPAIKVDNTTVMDSTGLYSVIHLMFDQTGKLLNTKIIAPRKKGQQVSVFFINSFTDKKLLLGINCFGDSSFTINNQPVSLPGILNSYSLLLKTDTSYTSLKTKILNPSGSMLYYSLSTSMPITTSSDSVYAIISYEFTPPFTSLDGLTPMGPLKSVLYVLDSSLTGRRQLLLGNITAGYYQPAPQRLKLIFRNIVCKNGQLFFNGEFTGLNESPINTIPVKDTTIGILPDLKLTVNQNGPTQNFVARCDLSGFNGIGKWYGDNHEYESMFSQLMYFHGTPTNRLAFAQIQDNVWNPWLMDDNLNILSGTMRKNADRPEATQMIRYFEDGSRIVAGYARGRTALDSTGNFTSNTFRSDAFLVRLRANDQVVWYKRFFSTIPGSDIRNLEIKNGKAWFLINYSGSANDSNYIKIDSSLYNVRGTASLLASIDTAGHISLVNLIDPLVRQVALTSFSFFSNGDIAAVSNSGYVSFPKFPPSSGSAVYIFRLKPAGTLSDIRRIYGPTGVDNIKVDKDDQIYISGGIYNPSASSVYLHNGTVYIDTLAANITSPTAAQMGVLKMDWDHFKWQKSFSIAFLSKAELLLINNRPVVFSPSMANQPLSWNGQLIHNGFSSMTLSLVQLDSNGVMIKKKVLPGFFYNYARGGSNGSIYLCGNITQPFNIDTIQVGNAGNYDGLGLVLDSNLTAKKSFRIASPYFEALLDMDIFQDSLVALAYIAQTNPQIYSNRMMVKAGDYEEDAYVGTITSRSNVVTAINNPLPVLHDVTVTPNPVTDRFLRITAHVPQALTSACRIYTSNGQLITSCTIYLVPGNSSYSIPLPHSLGKGVYHAIISNKKWTTARGFILQ